MTQPIDDYIRENRDRYTREAIHEQLLAAGHNVASIDAAWERVGNGSEPPVVGWRLRGRVFLVLVVVGGIGAGLIWAGQPYGAGGIAAVAYAVVATVALGFGKWVSMLVDRKRIWAAAAILAMIGGLAAYSQLSTIAGGSMLLGSLAIVGFGGVAVALVLLGRTNPRWAGSLGAAVPILLWLVVTGTCYAPLLSSAGR